MTTIFVGLGTLVTGLGYNIIRSCWMYQCNTVSVILIARNHRIELPCDPQAAYAGSVIVLHKSLCVSYPMESLIKYSYRYYVLLAILCLITGCVDLRFRVYVL